MNAAHRDGEITYYEELGVSPRASVEEIREAYRLYVRLLHPDQHTDPQLKEVAEVQMRKLNRVHAVLSDPLRRQAYDDSLIGESGLPALFTPVSPAVHQIRSKLAWAGAIAISAGLLIWLAEDSQPVSMQGRVPEAGSQTIPSVFAASPPVAQLASSGRRQNEQNSETEISRLRAELQTATGQRDAAMRDLNRLRASLAASLPTGSTPEPRDAKPVTVAMTEVPQLPPSHAAPISILPSVRLERERQLAGFWFYVKPPAGQMNKNQALYPPEYIEATVVEENGVLRGKFHARYEIVDRPISPTVDFTFTGTPNGIQFSGPWTGAGGSKGEVTLKLTSDNAMKIDWNASALGTQLGLSAGTATLTRRIE
jgi:curved DNA-binding protein CbpA